LRIAAAVIHFDRPAQEVRHQRNAHRLPPLPDNGSSDLLMDFGFALGCSTPALSDKLCAQKPAFHMPPAAASICLTSAVALRYVPLVERHRPQRI
jgi:hypothetical protein